MTPTDARNTSLTRPERLQHLLRRVIRDNTFYRAKYQTAGVDAGRADIEIERLPWTAKSELVEDQARNPPFGSNLTEPLDRYVRLHQTSGTTGRPLRWLDTAESWQWWLDCWQAVYRAAGVTSVDRIFVAFSFGPFIGFWTAYEAGHQLGSMMLPGGGLSSEQRLQMLADVEATVLVCTPTYALRLAEVARETGLALADCPIRVTIHAGEPGATIPRVKERIESAWGATCVDHVGATEVGAWGFGCGYANQVHINEEEFIAEVVDQNTGVVPAPDSDGRYAGELILTNLGRVGSPVIRYRTGDLVTLSQHPCPCGYPGAVLIGGVRGRVDDMIVVRGINVFPSALENIIRGFPEIAEFEVRVEERQSMKELAVRIEVATDDDSVSHALGTQIQTQLNLRPRIEIVSVGTLPRYELKARRFKTESS